MLILLRLLCAFTVLNLTVLSFVLPTNHVLRVAHKLRNSPSINQFSQYPGIPDWLLTNCNRLKYLNPTDVQKKTLGVNLISFQVYIDVYSVFTFRKYLRVKMSLFSHLRVVGRL